MSNKWRRLILVAVFVLGIIIGVLGVKAVEWKSGGDSKGGGSVALLNDLRLGQIIDSCKPADAKYLTGFNPTGRDYSGDVAIMEYPFQSSQAIWQGKTDGKLLTDLLFNRLQEHFGSKGLTLRTVEVVFSSEPNIGICNDVCYRCERSDGTAVGMLHLSTVITSGDCCRVAIVCASARRK